MDRPPQAWPQRSERRTFDVLRFAGHIFSDDPPAALEQLRIYYAWDEETGKVVIDQMPEHVKNDFT